MMLVPLHRNERVNPLRLTGVDIPGAIKARVRHERLRLRRRRFDELGPRAFEPAPEGVVTIRTTDPVLQIRMQVWIDKVRTNLVRAGL